MSKLRILVTGCAGFIGSNFMKQAMEEGHHVFGVDDLSNGHREFLPKSTPVTVCDFTEMSYFIGEKNYDVVVHLAAVPRVSYSVEHPLLTNDVNVTRTLKLMEACVGNVNRFVFASSSSVYGGADVLPTPETTPKAPKSPYALQKSIIEEYLALYYRLYGLDSACMRFFNVFGPRCLGTSPYSTAVSAWLTAIKQGKPLRFDGDGTQSRDMCYVDNVVDALLLACTHPGKLESQRFNVACGERISNGEIFQKLRHYFPEAQRIDAPWRAGDVMHTQADISSINRVLGYVPRVRFDEGLEKTVEWYMQEWDTIKNMNQSV